MAYSILFVTMDPFPPFRPDVEQLIGRELPKHGYRIDYVGRSKLPGNLVRKWPAGAAFINHWPDKLCVIASFTYCINHFKVSCLIIRKILCKNYDIILVKDKFVSALIPLLTAKISGRPFCYWLSYPFPERADQECRKSKFKINKIYNWLKARLFSVLLYRILLHHANHIFVQSDAMGKGLRDRGFVSEKITTLPMGIALELIRQVEANPCKVYEGKALLYLGALDMDRKIPFVLDVFRDLKSSGIDIQLFLVGGALKKSDISYIKTLIHKMSLEGDVVITGHISREQAWKYVKAADVCISPIPPSPVFDVSFPTKCVEYLALGRPVVANNIPSQQVLLNESNGGICVPYIREEFVKAIKRFLDNPIEAREAGEKGRQYVLTNYNYQKIGISMVDQLNKLID